MDGGVQDLIALALDKWTLLTAGGIFFLLRVLRQTPLSRWPIYWRVLPVLPESLGCAAAFLGGIPVVAEQPIIIKVAAGLWCGYLSQRTHKILGQSILGDDPDIIRPKKRVGDGPEPDQLARDAQPPDEGGR